MLCPICRKAVQPDGPFVPFCGERCRIIDLGNWASEKYVISTRADPQDLADSIDANIPNQEDDTE